MGEQTYEIEDLEVLTVGLVPKGANQEDFLLLKSQEGGGDMSEWLEEEPVEGSEPEEAPPSEEAAEEAGLIQALRRLLRKAAPTDPVAAAAQEMLRALRGIKVPPELRWLIRQLEAAAAGKPAYGYGYGYGYGYPAPMQKEEEMPETKEEEAPKIPPDLSEKLNVLEKANEELRVRLEKAEAEARAEREARRLGELVTRAKRFVALPASPEELGQFFLWLEKQEGGQEKAVWLEKILEAADQALVTSGLFEERGSSRGSELSAIEKALRSENFEEAILSLPPEEQIAYLKEMRRKA